MHKFLLRIIAFILVPCLAADPTLAIALSQKQIFQSAPSILKVTFAQEALESVLTHFGHPNTPNSRITALENRAEGRLSRLRRRAFLGVSLVLAASLLATPDLVSAQVKTAATSSSAPFRIMQNIFRSLDAAGLNRRRLVSSRGATVEIVNDEHVSGASWIKADFSSAGQNFRIPMAGTNWTAFASDPDKYSLRFLTLGAGNTYSIVILDGSGRRIRFPVGGSGGLMAANSTRNQAAVASFSRLKSQAPSGFNWATISAFEVIADQPGWLLMGDIQIIQLNNQPYLAMGIAGHDLQGPGWHQRLRNYMQYFGQNPVVGTYYTTIFEPIREQGDTSDHYSDLAERAKALSGIGVKPSVTLEFRSWARITLANKADPNAAAKINLERTRFNALNAGGIDYDSFMSRYVDQNRVLDAVAAGLLDPYLNRVAQEMSSLGPIYLRLFHEPYMWFPWGMRDPADIQKFKAAWIHVGDIFQQHKATNVMFVMTFDPYEPGGADWSEVAAIPEKDLSVVELDAYTDPELRKNASSSPNELMTKKLTEISWRLEQLYPNAAARPRIILGEFGFSGDQGSRPKELAYTWFINDMSNGIYPISGFNILNTYRPGPRRSAADLNTSPPQEASPQGTYWGAGWQPEDPWYSTLLRILTRKLLPRTAPAAAKSSTGVTARTPLAAFFLSFGLATGITVFVIAGLAGLAWYLFPGSWRERIAGRFSNLTSTVASTKDKDDESGLPRRDFVLRWAPAALASAFLAACNIGKTPVLGEAINKHSSQADIWIASPDPRDQVISVVDGLVNWSWYSNSSWTGWGFQHWANGAQTIDTTVQGREDIYLKLDLIAIGTFDIVFEDSILNPINQVGREEGMQSDDARIHKVVNGNNGSSWYISLKDVQEANPSIDLTSLKQIKFRAKSRSGSVILTSIQIVRNSSKLSSLASNDRPAIIQNVASEGPVELPLRFQTVHDDRDVEWRSTFADVPLQYRDLRRFSKFELTVNGQSGTRIVVQVLRYRNSPNTAVGALAHVVLKGGQEKIVVDVSDKSPQTIEYILGHVERMVVHSGRDFQSYESLNPENRTVTVSRVMAYPRSSGGASSIARPLARFKFLRSAKLRVATLLLIAASFVGLGVAPSRLAAQTGPQIAKIGVLLGKAIQDYNDGSAFSAVLANPADLSRYKTFILISEPSEEGTRFYVQVLPNHAVPPAVRTDTGSKEGLNKHIYTVGKGGITVVPNGHSLYGLTDSELRAAALLIFNSSSFPWGEKRLSLHQADSKHVVPLAVVGTTRSPGELTKDDLNRIKAEALRAIAEEAKRNETSAIADAPQGRNEPQVSTERTTIFDVIVDAFNGQTKVSDLWITSPLYNGQEVTMGQNEINWAWDMGKYGDTERWTGWGITHWADGAEAIDATRGGIANTYLRLEVKRDSDLSSIFDIIFEDNHPTANVGNEAGFQSDDERIIKKYDAWYIPLAEVQKANPAIDLNQLKQIKFRAKSHDGKITFSGIKLVHLNDLLASLHSPADIGHSWIMGFFFLNIFPFSPRLRSRSKNKQLLFDASA